MVGDAREVSLGGGEVGGLYFLVGYCGFGSIAGKAVLYAGIPSVRNINIY